MASLKKYYNLKANSILESVIAITIISVCLYFTILIFAVIFTSKTAAQFYHTQNKVNAYFFLLQLKKDSLFYENKDQHLILEAELVNDRLQKILIQYKDSISSHLFEKSFYVQH